jgi:hypothetical protein
VVPANPLLADWTGPYGGVPPWDQVKPELFPGAFEVAIAAQRAGGRISGQDEQMLGISGVPLLQKPFGAKVLADAVEQMVVKG